MAKRFIISSDRWRMEEGMGTAGCYLRYNSIMNHLCEKHGFVHNRVIDTSVYPYKRDASKQSLPEDTELIYMWLDTHSVDFVEMCKLFKQIPKAKIIWLVGGDRRTWHWGRQVMAGGSVFRMAMKEFLERVDVILDSIIYGWKGKPEYTTFCLCWPEYAYKHVFFPNSYVHEDAYESLEYNDKPIMKCILCGVPGGRYELRNYVISELANSATIRKYFAVIRHHSYAKMAGRHADDYVSKAPSKKAQETEYNRKVLSDYFKLDFIKGGRDVRGDIVGVDFARCLNNHFCGLGINGGRKVQALLMKHVEIPASGCLLLSERFYDMDAAGFRPNENYVQINAEYLTNVKGQYVKTDLVEKVIGVLNRPANYDGIRKAGMNFARAKHSSRKRFELLDEIITGLLSGRTSFRNYPKIAELGEK